MFCGALVGMTHEELSLRIEKVKANPKLSEALEHRDKLLHFDRTSARRTNVIGIPFCFMSSSSLCSYSCIIYPLFVSIHFLFRCFFCCCFLWTKSSFCDNRQFFFSIGNDSTTDDEEDYYESKNNVWLSDSERKEAIKREEQAREDEV